MRLMVLLALGLALLHGCGRSAVPAAPAAVAVNEPWLMPITFDELTGRSAMRVPIAIGGPGASPAALDIGEDEESACDREEVIRSDDGDGGGDDR